MKRMVLVVGMLVGLVAGCMEEYGVNDNGGGGVGPLPGDCNGLICGPGADPSNPPPSTPPAGCYGCDCKATDQEKQTCRSCVIRCRKGELLCEAGDAACKEEARACERGCMQ